MKERTTTREVHTLTPWESLITASLAGCMNVGLTLTDLDGRGEDASGVEDAVQSTTTSTPRTTRAKTKMGRINGRR